VNRTDEQLAILCRERDPDAWEEIVRRYQQRILDLSFQFTGNRDEARDLAQECFVRLYRNLDRYDRERPFRTWFYSLARNVCIDQYRRRRKDRKLIDRPADELVHLASAVESPEALVMRRERREALTRALDTLGTVSREAVVLKDLQDLSLEEMSRILEVPLGTVKSRVWRARCELARALVRARGRQAEDLP
jgi:RNA polymerase sigma-70 factor, ECF subfamily